MGVGQSGKSDLTDPDLESDMHRKPTKKALLPLNVGFLGKTVFLNLTKRVPVMLRKTLIRRLQKLPSNSS